MYKFSADRLKTLLTTKHLTERQFADQSGISRQLVYRWTAGTATPGLPHILKMCNKWGLLIDFFFPDQPQILKRAEARHQKQESKQESKKAKTPPRTKRPVKEAELAGV